MHAKVQVIEMDKQWAQKEPILVFVENAGLRSENRQLAYYSPLMTFLATSKCFVPFLNVAPLD